LPGPPLAAHPGLAGLLAALVLTILTPLGAQPRIGRELPVPAEPVGPNEITIGEGARTREAYLRSSLLVVRFSPGDAAVTVEAMDGVALGHASPQGWQTESAAFRLFDVRRSLRLRIRIEREGCLPATREVLLPPRKLVYEDFILAPQFTARRVAFAHGDAGNHDIAAVMPDGSGFGELVASPADETQPCFSADGGRLYYVSDVSGSRGIHALDLVSGETVCVVDTPSDEHSPACSPDGRTLAYVSDAAGDEDVFIASLDGSGAQAVSRHRGRDLSPSFSPDGQQIVFATDRWGSLDLAVVDLASGRTQRLTDDPRDEIDPAWSPDGEWIAFSLIAAGRPVLKLRHAMSPVGMGVDEAAFPPELGRGLGQPGWTADSQWLLCTRTEGRSQSVEAIRVGKGWCVPLTEPGVEASMARSGLVASPDRGTRILVRTSRGEMIVQLDASAAPGAVESFRRLVRMGFYNGLRFFRVVPGEVVEAGCPYDNGTGGPGFTVPFEPSERPHRRGTVSMIPLSEPKGVGSQFLICLTDLPQLDGTLVPIGHLAGGVEVADRIDAGDTIIEMAETGWE